MPTDKVQIEANNVQVIKRASSKSAKARARKAMPKPVVKPSRNQRRRRNRIAAVDIGTSSTPIGIQTGLAEVRTSAPTAFDSEECSDFSEQAGMFVANYTDPCGEHNTSLDAARVPDGALQTSAGAFFRNVTTLQFPWQIEPSIDLGGRVYSMLFLQIPKL